MTIKDLGRVFDIFESVSLEECESTVEWLEKVLASWKTVLIIKQLDARNPFKEEQVEPEIIRPFEERTTSRALTIKGKIASEVKKVLQDHNGGMTIKEISRASGINQQSIYQHLMHFEDRHYIKIIEGGSILWALKNREEVINGNADSRIAGD